jgi:cellulose synthase/poly-beta-1,6-N-acetylglucosamine synthase-like glycosyltransferase
MTTVTLEWLLAGSILAALYPLAGYPLVLMAVAALRPRRIRRDSFTPTVSLLIPAYNEADCIAATIENKLAQDYPADKLQIIVVSDASEDDTDAITTGFRDRGVELIRRARREGKAAALNEAVSRANGEIIVFSDANSAFATDAISRLVENFADPQIGYVTGRLDYSHGGETSGRGSGAYMRYENWLRRIESRVDSVIGVNGGVDAMRRNLYRPVPADQITDFVLPLGVIAAGYRVVFDDRAYSSEEANTEIKAEFRMRVRVALRALHGIAYAHRTLHVFRRPLPAFCILSHKVLRYGGFPFLALTLIFSVLLALRSPPFRIFLACEVGFYAVAAWGLSGRIPARLRRLSALPAYFVMSSMAFAIAAVRYLRGDVMATWKPRAG